MIKKQQKPSAAIKPKQDSGEKLRRTHARAPREGLFLNSWSAFAEYLRYQPEAIRSIEIAPKEEARLQTLLARHEQTLAFKKVEDTQTGLWVEVSQDYQDELTFLAEAKAKSRDLIIACDHITDTRNLGAIARSAAFFGVSSLLLPKDRQAPISSATLGTAQGAFTLIKPVQVTNLGRMLVSLKECGYWIAAADMEGMALGNLTVDYEKLVLVLGSEDKGVSPAILAKSDLRLSIQAMGGQLDSLNVSVAAGILIHGLKEKSWRKENPLL